ncbi:MAG: bifunctional phosphoserine phosphatase/homoserine phosphotransferase ThrH [Thermodesulfobacteriota bacterium]
MKLFCADLEGVFIPEIWIAVALKTGIEDLKLTTRDISDYDELMTGRLSLMAEHGLTIQDIQSVISEIDPLEGALDTLRWIRERTQIIILSDTFEEFAGPMMEKLEFPTLLCHNLTIDQTGKITGYNIRQQDQKKNAVRAFQSLNYSVAAFGDSYNDTGMLLQADKGFLFNPPENVISDFPDLPVAKDYNELKQMIGSCL